MGELEGLFRSGEISIANDFYLFVEMKINTMEQSDTVSPEQSRLMFLIKQNSEPAK